MSSEPQEEVQALGRYQVNNCTCTLLLIFFMKKTFIFFFLFLDDLFNQIAKYEVQVSSGPQGKQ